MDPVIQLKLDPWASDVDGAVAITADDSAPPAPVDVTVETPSWCAIDPEDAAGGPCFFIDGVRRVDAALLAGLAHGYAFGLLGSFAVGAVRAGDGTPEVLHLTTHRLLILGHGCEHPEVTVSLPGGEGLLRYQPVSVPGDEPEAPLLELQAAMRRSEAELGRALAGAGAGASANAQATAAATASTTSAADTASATAGASNASATPSAAPGTAAGTLIVADGPLAYLERTPTPLVGLVKSLRRAYLAGPERDLLPRLRPGQRTPMFSILDQNQRYSWYLRLANAGPGEHELAGIARLECSSQAGLPAARAVADRAAMALTRFASTRARDRRAPQNLVPIGGLEAALRHRLGDRALVHRAIRAHLAGGGQPLPAGELPMPVPAGAGR